MSHTEERNKAISLIRKLSSQTIDRGCTEGQAEQAMKKIGALLQQFNLSMDEVSLAAEECKEIRVSIGSTKGNRVSKSTAVAVAKFCDCVVYISKDSPGYARNPDGSVKYGRASKYARLRPLKVRGDSKLVFFGLTSDVEMAAYLMETIMAASETSLKEFKKTPEYINFKGHRLAATKSFEHGFASRTSARLNTMKEELEDQLQRAREARVEMGEATTAEMAEEAAKKSGMFKGTDLVIMKQKKVEENFKSKFGWSIKYRQDGGRGPSDYTASSAGRNAANSVNLSRPVGGGGYSSQLRLG